MMRREFLQSTSAMAAGAALGGVARAARARGPNVVLILTDDQGWGDIRSHGNALIDTPVLDRMAEEGARFDRFFVSPVCAPTRAALLTGRDHLRTGTCWVTHGLETMRASEVTIAEALRQAGYATGCFGKWHNGAHYPHHPNGQGFEQFIGFCAGHWNNYFDTGLEHNGKPIRTKGYITDVLTDAALGFIERHRAEPFFCYIPYNAPHFPCQLPDRYFDKYSSRGCDPTLASVYGMVENIDDNVGRILARLDELGIAKDTIVLFITDNGPNSQRYNGGMRGAKGSVYEGGVRVPCFVRWPGHIRTGTVIEPISAHIDMLPTLLELCEAKRPAGPPLDGTSVIPLLFGGGEGWPERRLFTHQARNGSVFEAPGSIRTQQYRMVHTDQGNELYDMLSDPGQQTDIAAQHPDLVRDLAAAYDAWFADATKDGFDRIPIPVGYPQAPRIELPAPEAYFEGRVGFKGKIGWANDWLTGWSSPTDRVWWHLDVVKDGRYEITLRYVCPEANVGSRIQVEVGGETLEAALSEPHDPAPILSPDRVPRGEVYEKEWAPLKLGTVRLKQGEATLTVRATSIPGAEAMDLKCVEVRRVD
jgi:arylsulfatase A-like enzyme